MVILAKDLVAELDTAVTDEDARAGDELPDLVLTLAAKRAARGTTPISHAESICRDT
jgi:hypothetical protein